MDQIGRGVINEDFFNIFIDEAILVIFVIFNKGMLFINLYLECS